MKRIFVLLVLAIFCLTGCDVDDIVITSDIIETNENVEEVESDATSSEEIVNAELDNEVNVPTTNTEEVDDEGTSVENIDVSKEAPIIESTKVDVDLDTKYKISDMELKGRDITTYGEFDEQMIQTLEKLLDNYSPAISLAVYSLDGSRGLVYNGNQEYFSACTVKIPWMIYLCKEIDAGNIDKDDILTYKERHWHDGSGSIRHGSYGDEYTIEELIKLCLSISDNVAYKMLVNDVIDRDGFNVYIDTLDLNRFLVPSWSIWCSNAITTDFLMIWEEVYNYFETNTVGAQILKEACTNTKYNYGTLTLKDYEYSHKSGDNWDPNPAYNDAGIVYADIPYIYAVFTKSEGGKNNTSGTVNSIMSVIHEEFCNTKNKTVD